MPPITFQKGNGQAFKASLTNCYEPDRNLFNGGIIKQNQKALKLFAITLVAKDFSMVMSMLKPSGIPFVPSNKSG